MGLKTTLNPERVRAIKNLPAAYNKNANKIVKLAKQEKDLGENLNFLVVLATIAIVAEDERLNFSKAWNHLNKESQRKWH